jgi:hypothetical protein
VRSSQILAPGQRIVSDVEIKRGMGCERATNQRTYVESSTIANIGHLSVGTSRDAVQNSKLGHRARGICRLTRGRGAYRPDRNVERFGQDRRQCQDV